MRSTSRTLRRASCSCAWRPSRAPARRCCCSARPRRAMRRARGPSAGRGRVAGAALLSRRTCSVAVLAGCRDSIVVVVAAAAAVVLVRRSCSMFSSSVAVLADCCSRRPFSTAVVAVDLATRAMGRAVARARRRIAAGRSPTAAALGSIALLATTHTRSQQRHRRRAGASATRATASSRDPPDGRTG